MLNFQGLLRLHFSSCDLNIEMIESGLCNVVEHKSSLFSIKKLTNQNAAENIYHDTHSFLGEL